ncbi:molybdenum cofactor biosynthesis protein A [Flavobacterium columnare]|uniref:Radical SAM protein n=2 Tax=Flavobacterium TaxID=237 RepID=A0ABW8PQZ4_9FLAO|nr:radical SAM protein [Flavobacterium columnare]SPE76240.1 molybdenum cofactor biosynthesis protein A [Flavobacterium columnare]
MTEKYNVGVNLTRRCNMKCTWCYYEDLYYVGSKNDKIPFNLNYDADIEMLKHKLSEIEIDNIYLTGGEPTTYPYLKEIIDWLKDKVHGNIFVCTNAKLIDDSLLEYLALNNIKLLISIKDNGDKTNNLFNKINNAGVGIHIYHVLTKKSIPILKEFIEKFGWVEKLRLLYETSSNPEKNIIKHEEWFGLLNIAHYYLNPIIDKVEVEVGFLPDTHEISKSDDRGAVKRYILDYNGKVYACPLLVEKNNGCNEISNQLKCSVEECPVLCNSKSTDNFTPICPFLIANLNDLVSYINTFN